MLRFVEKQISFLIFTGCFGYIEVGMDDPNVMDLVSITLRIVIEVFNYKWCLFLIWYEFVASASYIALLSLLQNFLKLNLVFIHSVLRKLRQVELKR